MPRLRFNKNPVDKLLTFSEYTGIYYEEPLILHHTAQRMSFTHWADYFNYFGYSVTKEEPYDFCIDNFDLLKAEVALGLKCCSFFKQSKEVKDCTNEN